MNSRILVVTVFAIAGAAACGGKVAGQATGGSGGSAGSGSSNGVGGSTSTGGTSGTAGVGGSTGTGGTGATAGTGGSPGQFCSMIRLGEGSLEPAEADAAFDGPAVVATPQGFVASYVQMNVTGMAIRVQHRFNDVGEWLASTSETLAVCPEGTRSNGVGAAWNDVLGAGLMTASLLACDSEKPQMNVVNFDEDGATITEITYDLPKEITLAPVKSVAAAPTGNAFWLVGTTDEAPFLYVFEGVAVQPDPPPTEVNTGHGSATFGQVDASAELGAFLTGHPAQGGATVFSAELLGAGMTETIEMPPSKASSVTAWEHGAAVATASPSTLEYLVYKSASGWEGGSFDGGPYTSVDTVEMDNELWIAGAKPGEVRLFRIGKLDQTPPIGATEDAYQLDIPEFDGTRVSVASARGMLFVAWMNAKEVLSVGVSPGGYVVLACGE